ncbi:PREDICTED: extracellular calcium-sensing receptor-like [Nanorana parkeri]|uniref:extracellular calcium-sensing receptor-like n=1 Tax=Nanorana parkeri TaxID=125878 RepID=UPI0008542977|nr:PREDICTED: extracellular calcium-sensing receptor-like [Nanorana parkeri]
MRLVFHVYWSLWHLILTYVVPASHSDQVVSRPRGLSLVGATQTGDVLIGAILPIHLDKEYPDVDFTSSPPQGACKMFSFEVFQQFQALRFAVEEINKNLDLLPNISLGFQVYDSCSGLHEEIDGTHKLLTGWESGIPNYSCREGSSVAAVIGHSISSFSLLMAHVLGLYRYPQISHFSTSSVLSDRAQFPSFYRTVPSDVFQSKGLAQLVLHFGWTWVGLVAVSEDYGQQGIQVIRQELIRAGACEAFVEYLLTDRLDKNAPHVTKVIQESTAKVVLIFSTDTEMVPLLNEMLAQNITGKIFMASEAWSTSNLLSIRKYSSLLSGSVGFSFHSSVIHNFKYFLNRIQPFSGPGKDWAKILWESIFGCQISDREMAEESLSNFTKACTGEEDLESTQNSYNDVTSLRGAHNIYTAIYVIAKALHDLHMCKDGKGPFSKGSCSTLRMLKPWQLSRYIQKVHVRLSSGREMVFDENGDPPATYDIVNWKINDNGVMGQVKVGSYDTTQTEGKTFNIDTSAVMWASGDRQVPYSVCSSSCPPGFRQLLRRGQPVCCFECVSCPQVEISNTTDPPDCIKCPWDQWPNLQKDKCLAKDIEFLSYEEPLGVVLAASSVFSSSIPPCTLGLFIHYRNTPLVRANNFSMSCLLLVSLFLCFLSSLGFIGYPQPEKCLLRQTAFGMSFAFCVSCILAKNVMVVFAFMATKPGSQLKKLSSPKVSYMIITMCMLFPFVLCVLWMIFAPPFPEKNVQTRPGIIIIECNEGSPTAFWCMLGYLGLLATVSFVVAFLARRLPDSFNEAKFITFSMLAFLSVWISFIPAYLSASGKYAVAMEIFAIQSSSWALEICMFFPKSFIVLFRPSMNSRDYLMGKNKG